jgi:5'-phosphate synthase pdxT subunit
MEIGVLALQGAVAEHVGMLRSLGVEAREVRHGEDCQGLDGLLIPGGESTTLEKLVRRFGIDGAIAQGVENGMAVWGTCAGMILIASEIEGGIVGQTGLGLFPMRVKRNAFGRQLASCEVDLDIPILGDKPFPAVFIRAPVAEATLEPGVRVLARLEEQVVALDYKRLMATSFHPELTGDPRLHRQFLSMVRGDASPGGNFPGTVEQGAAV